MGELSTAYPQVTAIILAVFTAGLLANVALTVYLFRKEFPGKTLVSGLKKDLARVDGELGDLEDRFTRFQKRRGMQDARKVKTDHQDALAEAQAIIAAAGGVAGGAGQPAGAPSGKAALWAQVNRSRGH